MVNMFWPRQVRPGQVTFNIGYWYFWSNSDHLDQDKRLKNKIVNHMTPKHQIFFKGCRLRNCLANAFEVSFHNWIEKLRFLSITG